MSREKTGGDAPSTGSSAERSLNLLARLAAIGKAMSLADLAAELGLPKATAHRLCTQLQDSGFIARGLNEREYIVGPALRKMALDTLNHGTERGLRHEVLADLVADVGETCNFTTTDGAGVLYLDRVEAPWPWRLTMEVGAHVPLHCTASGKLFLATMPAAKREQLLDHLQLARMTANTLVSLEALREECRQIAEAGHSLDREEFMDGLVAAAVPVRDAQGMVRAALAVHGPIARMPIAKALAHVPKLHAAAERMGRLL